LLPKEAPVHARPALFDLYGDHLHRRDDRFRDRAPVAALVRLLAPLGVAAPAARTAVSRMVRQGWLDPVRLAEGPGYQLTPRAVRRLDDAAARIYRTTGPPSWDGSWQLLVVTPPSGRSGRERLAAGLSFLGYGPLDATTWLSPRQPRSAELDALLAAEGTRAERFTAIHDGHSQTLIGRAWDLDGIARAYLRFLDEAADITADSQAPGGPAETAFVARSRLVHAWRRFLFLDPGLPAALLPVDWPGDKAATQFATEAARLLPAATRFVDSCLPPHADSTAQVIPSRLTEGVRPV
jgi:phenylacetic acid degradation operon negative regulatory protein